MNIATLLRIQATTQSQALAIIDTHQGSSRTLSFAQLELASARAAALLQQAGLVPGEGVLILQPMTAELYIALMAIFRLGLVAMFLDPSAGRSHIEQCCALYRPKALIASSKAHLLRFVSPALRRIPLQFVIGLPVPGAVSWHRIQHLTPYEQIHPCTPETPALLTFTSGSTGKPKAAVRSHGFLIAQHRALAESLRLTAGEVDLTTLPIFVLANLASGVTSLIPNADLRSPGTINAPPVVAQIQIHQPTSTAASPALLERLADYCIQHGLLLPSFQKIFIGGAPVFPHQLDKLNRVATSTEITTVYGSTEAEPIAHVAHHAIDEVQAGSAVSRRSTLDSENIQGGSGLLAGLPVTAIQLRILRYQWGKPIGPYTGAEFAAACLLPGEVGEIVVSGEHVLAGYLYGHGDAETKFRVEGISWHRTGDAGYLDACDRLWLLGRCHARIEDTYGILYPFAVESLAYSHLNVQRAAVVSHGGKRILAVELKRTHVSTVVELLQTLAWAHIEAIKVYPKIPVDKRHNAKIDYPALYRLMDKS